MPPYIESEELTSPLVEIPKNLEVVTDVVLPSGFPSGRESKKLSASSLGAVPGLPFCEARFSEVIQ